MIPMGSSGKPYRPGRDDVWQVRKLTDEYLCLLHSRSYIFR